VVPLSGRPTQFVSPLNIGSHYLSYDNMSTTVVQRSMAIGKPVIFVSMNYR
jgi:hypothetical protein